MKRLFIGGPADGQWRNVEYDRVQVWEQLPVIPYSYDEPTFRTLPINAIDYEAVMFHDLDETIKVMVPVSWNLKGVLRALIEGYKK